jgi:hypothetical protein
VVTACEKAMGRELPVRFVAPGEAIPGQREEVGGFMAAMESYESMLDMAETARTYGVALTPLEVVAERMFGGAGS